MKKFLTPILTGIVLLGLLFFKQLIPHAHADVGFTCDDVRDVPVSECQVLVDFYNANTGSDLGGVGGWAGALVDNIPDSTVCDWLRVACNHGEISTLQLDSLGLTTIPASIENLTGLTQLIIGHNELTSFPETFWHLISLNWLDISSNSFTSVPDGISYLTGLQTLMLYSNHLTTLPDSMSNLSLLTTLDVDDNQLSSLPDTFSSLSGLIYLDIGMNLFTTLPSILSGFTHLEGLSMYQDSLTSLPDWIDHLTSLFYLDVSTNHLQSLPDSIGNMTAFSYLYLYGNQLTSLPESIINLTGLAFDRGPTFSTESVIVGGNPILDIHDNKLVTLPGDLFYEFAHSILFAHPINASSNCLYVSGLSDNDILLLDDNDLGWRDSQSVCNDTRLIDASSGTEQINLPLLLHIEYAQDTGASVLTGFIDIDVGTGMVSGTGNSDWTQIDSGIYEYTILSVGTPIAVDSTILFTGAFAEGAQTGVLYNYTLTIRSGYDITDENNATGGTYAWKDEPIVTPTHKQPIEFAGGDRFIDRTGALPSSTLTTDQTGSTIPPTDIPTQKNTVPPSYPKIGYGTIYTWAYDHGITMMPISSAKLFEPMQRYEAATMIVKFIENVLHQDIPHNDACDMTHYQDFAFFGPKTQKTDVIEKICDLGIMGWKDGTKDPLDVFRPHDILTEEEMNLIINRYFTGENINSITKTRKIDLINLLMMKTQ